MEIWFHLANVLYVVSYLVTDILWLRALAVLGGLSSLTWTLTTPTPSLAFIGWTLVYNTINMVQIGRLWQERRQVRSGGADAVCGGVPHAHPARVPAAPGGGPVAGSAGEGGVDRPGRAPRAHARARVGTDGRESGRTRSSALRLGQFAGEMSFLTGARTTAAVEVIEPARFVSWATDDLECLLGKHPELRAALQLVLGRDLAAKLVGDRERT